MDRMEKFAMSVFVVICLIVIAAVILLGWGFIEIVQWLTSK